MSAGFWASTMLHVPFVRSSMASCVASQAATSTLPPPRPALHDRRAGALRR